MERTITCKNNKGRRERNHKRTPRKQMKMLAGIVSMWIFSFYFCFPVF